MKSLFFTCTAVPVFCTSMVNITVQADKWSLM